MTSDVDSEKLLAWIGLSKKLKMTNETIVNNLQVMLINIKFETDKRMQRPIQDVPTTAQTFPEPIVPQQAPPPQVKAPKQPETPQLKQEPIQLEEPQLTVEQQFDSLSDIQFTILKTMSEATEQYNLKTFARQVNLKSNQIIQQLEELTRKGILQKIGNSGYSITEKGQAYIRAHAHDKSENPDKQEGTATKEKKRNKRLSVFNFSQR
jgi:predicted transcriptional regulator